MGAPYQGNAHQPRTEDYRETTKLSESPARQESNDKPDPDNPRIGSGKQPFVEGKL
jgi:hypothetical protein